MKFKVDNKNRLLENLWTCYF